MSPTNKEILAEAKKRFKSDHCQAAFVKGARFGRGKEEVPRRIPSDWDHHLETPEQTKERDELLESKNEAP